MIIGELAALLSAVAIGGGAAKWGYDRWRKSVIATDEHPMKEVAITTAAADSIAKAAGAVVVMLQGELTSHANQLIEMNDKFTDIATREKLCQDRLAALETQAGLGGAQ